VFASVYASSAPALLDNAIASSLSVHARTYLYATFAAKYHPPHLALMPRFFVNHIGKKDRKTAYICKDPLRNLAATAREMAHMIDEVDLLANCFVKHRFSRLDVPLTPEEMDRIHHSLWHLQLLCQLFNDPIEATDDFMDQHHLADFMIRLQLWETLEMSSMYLFLHQLINTRRGVQRVAEEPDPIASARNGGQPLSVRSAHSYRLFSKLVTSRWGIHRITEDDHSIIMDNNEASSLLSALSRGILSNSFVRGVLLSPLEDHIYVSMATTKRIPCREIPDGKWTNKSDPSVGWNELQDRLFSRRHNGYRRLFTELGIIFWGAERMRSQAELIAKYKIWAGKAYSWQKNLEGSWEVCLFDYVDHVSGVGRYGLVLGI
ncbi:MAG: hypothetical protein M1819_006514, partial [Sarea resinae]